MKKYLVTIVCILTTCAFGATVGVDNAGNYAAGSFTNGVNGGTGFQAWNIFASGSGGAFLGDSTEAGGGDINSIAFGNSVTQAFGFWGNPSGGNYINAYRQFAGGALSMGQSFTVKIGVNWRNGNKGLDLLSGGVSVYNLNVGSDDYLYEDKINGSGAVSFGWAYSASSIIEVKVTQGNAGVLTQAVIDVYRYTTDIGTNTDSQTFTFTGAIDELKLYCGDTDASGSQNNLYANDLAIVPEPMSITALLAILAIGIIRRR